MGDTHAARAEALAAEAEAIMRKEIELENKGHTNAFAAAGIGGNKWQRVQALQAQAQVHATLALAEEVARGRISG
ncbi:hypothetical protein ACFVAV_33365 [Nocardia sp. NPDC057663]|uniref:hypothetical protein n=1 Tax=Nocardia sp. NPDC057663 TaxID=3346201 RepID=UPI003672908D